MGETITHETVQDEIHGPLTAVARCVHHILSNGGTAKYLLSNYINEAGVWNTITVSQMKHGIRTSVKILKLDKNGIYPDLVGIYSLRAGGAMALIHQETGIFHFKSHFYFYFHTIFFSISQ